MLTLSTSETIAVQVLDGVRPNILRKGRARGRDSGVVTSERMSLILGMICLLEVGTDTLRANYHTNVVCGDRPSIWRKSWS